MTGVIPALWRGAQSWRLPHHQRRPIALRPVQVHLACTRAASTTPARADDSSLSALQNFAIVTHHPASTTQGELLSTIHPTELPIQGHFSGVLLLSKRFADWLAGDDAFLHKFVNALWKPVGSGYRDQSERGFSLLACVVDGLPRPDAFSVVKWRREEAHSQNDGQSFDSEIASDECCDGLAFASSSWSLSHGSRDVEHIHEAPKDVTSPSLFSSPQSPKFISFTMSHVNSTGSTSLTLPLANTIFHTGSSSTSCMTHWRRTSATFEMVEREEDTGDHYQVSLPAPVLQSDGLQKSLEHDARTYGADILMHLHPLTSFRRVKASMGNVISRLVSDTDEGPTESLASEELEVAVAKFIQSSDNDAQNFSVWAILIPGDSYTKDPVTKQTLNQLYFRDEQATDRNRSEQTSLPCQLLWRGARLHRVLSGGGGWGEKAGLLSLDPETDYSGRMHSSMSPAVDSMVGTKPFMKDVVASGDFIGFYAAPNQVFPNFADSSADDGSRQAVVSSLKFGVLPNSMDEIAPAMDTTKPMNDTNPKISIFRGHFGALSEGGMALRSLNNRSKSLVQTRLDVPFASVSFLTARKARD